MIALPRRADFPTARHYGPAWERLGVAFPELEIRLVDIEAPLPVRRWLLERGKLATPQSDDK